MMTEREVRKILLGHWSRIFPHWENHRKGDKGELGMGKGEAWYEMYKAVINSGVEIKTFLNIGLGEGKGKDNPYVKWCSIYEDIYTTIDKFIALEIDKKTICRNNVAKISPKFKKYFRNVYHGDIREIDKIEFKDKIDMILWSHGPEHIYRDEWGDTFDKLMNISPILIIGLPWGSGYDGCKFHVAKSVERGEFEKYGFDVVYAGEKTTQHACMYGWKIATK